MVERVPAAAAADTIVPADNASFAADAAVRASVITLIAAKSPSPAALVSVSRA